MTSTESEFDKATDYSIQQKDIERAQALVDVDAASSSQEQFTTASYDVIRNFARGYGDDNPLFLSEDYGRYTRWGSQIAPPMIGVALNTPLLGDPIDPSLKKPSFRGVHVFVSGSSWEWYRPV